MADEGAREGGVEVTALIDERPLSGFQIFVFALCALVVFLDGFDAQAIGYVAPALVADWEMANAGVLGPVFSSALVGLMLGALLIAPLADRIGRRPVILVSLGVVGVFSLATAFAQDLNQLIALRFLTGLGLGGCMPNAISLTSEYAPARTRSLLVMLMFSGFTLGSVAGGLLSAQFVPAYGWRVVFVAGGVAPLALLVALVFVLPESIRYLGLDEKRQGRLRALVGRLAPGAVGPEARLYTKKPEAARMSVIHLFKDGRTRATLLLWLVFFMSLLDIYLLVNWLPTAMAASGAPQRIAILIGTVLQVGGLLSVIPIGWALDRGGPRGGMAPAYLAGALAIAGIGLFAGVSLWATVIAVFVAGLGVIGGQTAANAVAATSYPTEIRSTGVGWALGVGRIGSIIGPTVAGWLIAMEVSVRDVFLLAAIPALLGAIASLFLAGASRRPAQVRA